MASTLWGLGRVAALETPSTFGGLVDLDPDLTAEVAAQWLLPELVNPTDEPQIAFYPHRHVARLMPWDKTVTPEVNKPSSLPLSPDATYLITGGLGALGLQVARRFVEQGARSLVLMGRRPPSPAVQAEIETLEELGATIRAAQADVTAAEQVKQVLADCPQTLPLKGIIHAAGVLDDGALPQQTWARFAKVIAPKVQGAWTLHKLTHSYDLDFFVLFSSAAALLGATGQSNYAAANAFLDQLAHYRQAQGLPGLSLNWGAWAEVGMAADLNQRRADQGSAPGIEPLPVAAGLQILDLLLPTHDAQVGVLPVTWSTFLATYFPNEIPPVLEGMAERSRSHPTPQASSQTPPTQQGWLDQLQAVPVSERPNLLLGQVRELVVHVLRLGATQRLDPQMPLIEMGMDSLMALELRNALEKQLTCALPATLLFDYPSLNALVDYLTQQVLAPMADPAPATAEIVADTTDANGTAATGTVSQKMDTLFADESETDSMDAFSDLDNLSDAEVEQILLQKLMLLDED